MTPRKRAKTAPLPAGIIPNQLPSNVRWEADRRRWVYRYWDGDARRKVILGGIELTVADIHRGVEDVTLPAVSSLETLGKRFFASREFAELSPSTQYGYKQSSKTICGSLNRFGKARGGLPLKAWDAPACKRYYSERRDKSESGALADIRYLRRLFNWAIEEGHMTTNPAKSIKTRTLEARTHYVQDVDYQGALNLAPANIALMLHLIYLTGRRRTDILTLTRQQLSDEGIEFAESKTGKLTLILWSDELEQTVNLALEMSRGSMWLFPTSDNPSERYRDSALNTALQRLRGVMREKGLVPFQAKDLRAKHASDLEERGGDATAALRHGSRGVTVRHYLRRPTKVASLR